MSFRNSIILRSALLLAICLIFLLASDRSVISLDTSLNAAPESSATSLSSSLPLEARPSNVVGNFKARPASTSLAPLATTITATKVDALQTDVNLNGKADPGDTLMYTVTITNTGAMDATGVNFADTIDANTTLVPGSLTASPIAVNDTYQTIGNVDIDVPAAQGLLANDLNPNGSGSLTITAFDATSANGGTVTVNTSTGAFTYNPAAGFTGTSDSFNYTLGNGTGKTNTATVTINFNGKIWFIDDSSTAPDGGDGRRTTPFKGLVGTDTPTAKFFSNSPLDQAGDSIFLFSGSYTGGLTLLNDQRLIGQGAADTLLNLSGLSATPPSGNNLLPATNGTDPVITTSGATAITLAQNNRLHGFTVGNTTAAGTDIAGTSFGTLTIKDVTVNGTGRALNLMTGTFASGSTFDAIESSGGSSAEGARLNTVGGSFTSTTTNIVNPTGTGIDVQSAPSGTSFSFGSTTVNKGSSAGTGVNLNSNSGTFTFTSLAVTTSNGTGVSATSSGTVNVTTGSISSTNAPALVVNPTTLGMTFTSVSSTNSTGTGISLTSASGSLTIGTTTITNPSGIGITATSCSAALNFGNTTANSSGGTGVVLGGSGTGNTGTITFGALNIAPDANQRGLLAQENTMTITSTSGTISTTGAPAVEITRSSSTTPLMISLTKVSMNESSGTGGANGIKLKEPTAVSPSQETAAVQTMAQAA